MDKGLTPGSRAEAKSQSGADRTHRKGLEALVAAMKNGAERVLHKPSSPWRAANEFCQKLLIGKPLSITQLWISLHARALRREGSKEQRRCARASLAKGEPRVEERPNANVPLLQDGGKETASFVFKKLKSRYQNWPVERLSITGELFKPQPSMTSLGSS